MRLRRFVVLFLLLPVACGRLDHLGKEPSFSPIGAVAAPPAPAEAAPPPVGPGRQATASLWSTSPGSFLGERRAQRQGDILTVVIEIDDRAQISNSTARSRSGSETMSIAALLGLPEALEGKLPPGTSLDPAAQFGGTSSASGDGSVSRNERITLRIAATVTQVLGNGHLVVQGLQEVRVNFEMRVLQIAGIVRPEDISRYNEITYDKIADARIAYGGRGQITDMQQPRYGQQLFDALAPF